MANSLLVCTRVKEVLNKFVLVIETFIYFNIFEFSSCILHLFILTHILSHTSKLIDYSKIKHTH